MNLEATLLQIPVDASWALFIATVFLVVITGFYAIQTYRLVNVPFRPALLARLAYTTTGRKSSIEVEIENIGIGTAVAITCTYSIGPLNQIVNIALLKPQTSSRLGLNLPNLEDKKYYHNNPTKIQLNLTFKDVLEHKFTYRVSLDVSKFAQEFKNPFA